MEKSEKAITPSVFMNLQIKIVSAVVVVLCLHILCASPAAGITDRVVASVDNNAITLSEFARELEAVRLTRPGVSEQEVINAMINRKLLLLAAKKYRIEEKSEDGIIREYIDLKIRAFVRITPDNIENFYVENHERFEGKYFEDVREEIENYLTEQEINKRLKEVLEELKKQAYVRIQLESK